MKTPQTLAEKISRFDELNTLIFKLNTKKKKTPKDFDKLAAHFEEQDKLCEDVDLMDFINKRAMSA